MLQHLLILPIPLILLILLTLLIPLILLILLTLLNRLTLDFYNVLALPLLFVGERVS